MKNVKNSILSILLTCCLIVSVSAQTDWKTIPITQQMKSEFEASADAINLKHKEGTHISDHQASDKEKIGSFLSNRITFELLFKDLGITDLYGKDYPVSQFFREQRLEFMNFLNEGIRNGQIKTEQQIRDYYIKFVYTVKNRIINKQYNVDLKGSDNSPMPPPKVAGGPCVNMDFEDGTTNGWELYDGQVTGTSQYSFSSSTVVGPGASHLIVSGGTDPVCGIPMVNPAGGSYSCRLGDGTTAGYGAARMRQTFMVTAANSLFTYSYAVIIQSPAGHNLNQQPYFSVRVYDQSNNDVSCGAYSVTATGNTTDFITTTYGGEALWYKNWTTVFAPLQAYIGQNVTIEFTTGDCGQGGHFGYAYIDASCGGDSITASAMSICSGNPVTLTAPAGAASYLWDTGETTQVISTTTGGTHSVTLIPVSGSACQLSLSIDIGVDPSPTAIFSDNPTNICQGQVINFTDASTVPSPGTIANWQWNFGDGISSPMGNGTMSGVTATTGTYTDPSHTFNSSGNFNVTLTIETPSGCQSTVVHPVVVTPGPTVNAGPDLTVCQGTATTLTASGTASTYTWNNGVTNGAAFIQDTGSYNYILTGANGACVAKDTMNLTVIANPTPSISTASYCQGSSTTIDAGSGYASYLWSNGGTGQTGTFTAADNPIWVKVTTASPGCTGTSQSITVTEIPIVTHDSTISICSGQSAMINGVSQTTGGNYSQTYTSAAGCDSISNITLVVNPLPNINAGSPATICQGVQTTLSATGGTTYSWNNGITNNQPFPVNSTVTYTVTGTDANGCINTSSVTITMDVAPTMNAGVDQSICKGDSTTLTASGSNNFTWNNGVTDGVNFAPNSTNSYIVTGTSVSGCLGYDTVIVNVNALPTISGNNPTVCDGASVTLSGTGGVSYTWNNGVTNGVSFIPATSGIYTVTGTDANGCVNTGTSTVTVNTYPDANISATPTSGHKPLGVQFANGSTGANSFTWDFGDGNTQSVNSISGENHLYFNVGTYDVILTANNNGCIDTAMVIITVIPFGPLGYHIPNVFTPNGDGQNDYFTLNLVNASALNLQIFNRWGNPMSTITDVNTKGWDGKTQGGTDADEGTYFFLYQITDMDGQSVKGQGFLQLERN